MNNVEYLKDKPIAVIGGGATGRAQAADCALAGREARMYELPEFAAGLGTILTEKTITVSGDQPNLYGFKRAGKVQVAMVSTDMGEVMKGAGLVVISLPAVGFKKVLAEMVPYLEDGQVIHFMTGNFGSLMLRRLMREAGCTKRIIVGEWTSQPFGARVESLGGVQSTVVRITYRAITLRGAALPSSDQELFFESIKHLPSMDPVRHPVQGDTVVDIGFSNVNPILHVPGTILGVSTMENFGVIFGDDKYKFSIYSHAYCPSISEVQYAVYQEECRIAEALGIGIQSFEKQEFFSRTNILGAEIMGPGCVIPFDQQAPFAYGTGPFDINNRYITEDIPVGCHIFYRLAKKFGVEVPTIEAMIHLGNLMTKHDFFQEGVTLAELGLEHLDRVGLLDYLRNGVI